MDLTGLWRCDSCKQDIEIAMTDIQAHKNICKVLECFDPIVVSTTGCDLIPSMVYGRNMGGQEFGGMYCAVLTVNSSVVSAGILRVFGQEVAELPLVATSNVIKARATSKYCSLAWRNCLHS